MRFFLIPDHITIGLDARTHALVERILDLLEGEMQKQIDELAAKLNAATGGLADTVKANPDPNTTD